MQLNYPKSELDEYSIYKGMLRRCFYTDHIAYKNYGGRGIGVQTSWVDSFDNFLSDMGFRPSRKHTLDRINNDSHYTKANCRWSLNKQQSRNKRSNVRLTLNGVTKTAMEWAIDLKINPKTLYSRISRGFTTEQILIAGRYHPSIGRIKNKINY